MFCIQDTEKICQRNFLCILDTEHGQVTHALMINPRWCPCPTPPPPEGVLDTVHALVPHAYNRPQVPMSKKLQMLLYFYYFIIFITILHIVFCRVIIIIITIEQNIMDAI